MVKSEPWPVTPFSSLVKELSAVIISWMSCPAHGIKNEWLICMFIEQPGWRSVPSHIQLAWGMTFLSVDGQRVYPAKLAARIGCAEVTIVSVPETMRMMLLPNAP